MKLTYDWNPYREEELGDGAGVDAGSTDNVGDDSNDADGDSSASTARPDYVPEKFWDADAGTIRQEDVFKSYTQLESKIGANKEAYFKEFEEGRLSQRPESAEAYELKLDPKELELPEGVNVNINKDDPLLKWWAEEAFKNGYTNEQFNEGVKQYMAGELQSLPQMEKEREALGENAEARISRVELWARKNAGDELFEKIQHRLGNSDAVMFMEAIMKKTGSISMGDNEVETPGKLTKDEIRAMQDDPRYWRDSDPVYIKKVEEAWKQLHNQK